MIEKLNKQYKKVLRAEDFGPAYILGIIILNLLIYITTSSILLYNLGAKKEILPYLLNTLKITGIIDIILIVLIVLFLFIIKLFVLNNMKKKGYYIFYYYRKLKISIPPEEIIIDEFGNQTIKENYKYFIKGNIFYKTFILEISEDLYNNLDGKNELIISFKDFKFVNKEDLMYVR